MRETTNSSLPVAVARPASGYVSDVAYPRAFVPQITPPTLRLVAALNGYPAPPEHDFDYCDLGCATGDTLVTLAAANPGARFVGVERNGDHVRTGRGRVERGGLRNVRFVERDFEELGSADGEVPPLFDFIVAHGIWSWVSPRKRDAILAFVRSHLKPGGLFYLSYNALPGWSSVEPLRRLMLENTAARGTTLERAREGVQLAQRLADSGAAYFASHPTAKSMLALMQKGGLPYVAHEYFHADWQPMYFADVARSLANSDPRPEGDVGDPAPGPLAFLGQVPLYANVRELAIPPSLKKIAESVPDRIALEGLKDFATNELFRCDVYVRGKVSRSVSETQYYFEGTPFGTLAPLAHVKREVRLPFYTVEYKEPIYEALLAAIAEHACTAMTLMSVPELAALGQLRVGDCLQSLVLGGQVVPMAGAPAPAHVSSGGSSDDGKGLRIVLPYNELVLEEALAEEGPLVFASPVLGAGVQVSLLEALCIRLVTDPSLSREAYPDKVRDYARSRPMPISIGDRKIKDADELVRVMAREIERFRTSSLAKLVELGVLGVA